MRAYKNQSLALEPENGDLAMTRCGKQVVTRSGAGPGKNL